MDYVNNKRLYEEIVNFFENNVISEELHLIFYTMAERILRRPRFIRCTPELKEDLIIGGYLKCIKVLQRRKYDATRTNPFSYFTSVIGNEFKDLIKLENKQIEIKEKIKEYYDIRDELGIVS